VISSYDEYAQSASHAGSFVSLPPGTSPSIQSPLPLRSSSPFSVASHPPPSSHSAGTHRDRERDVALPRKKPPGASVAALGILKALEPQLDATSRLRSRSEEHLMVSSESFSKEKKEKRGFWERTAAKDREKDQDKDRGKERDRRDDESQAELTRMIGTFIHPSPVTLDEGYKVIPRT
jgi:hypothetical protein